MNQLKFKKLHPDAIIPTRANPTDAGLDIYALEDVELPESQVIDNQFGNVHYPVRIGQEKIRTGIAVEIPHGYYGKVSSRSGLAFKSGLFCFDGTIDAGYRGEIGILMYNTTDKPYAIDKGQRIAQLIVLPFAELEPVEVDELSTTDRGDKGFGSSGS